MVHPDLFHRFFVFRVYSCHIIALQVEFELAVQQHTDGAGGVHANQATKSNINMYMSGSAWSHKFTCAVFGFNCMYSND